MNPFGHEQKPWPTLHARAGNVLHQLFNVIHRIRRVRDETIVFWIACRRLPYPVAIFLFVVNTGKPQGVQIFDDSSIAEVWVVDLYILALLVVSYL